jgi:hypothetical protein
MSCLLLFISLVSLLSGISLDQITIPRATSEVNPLSPRS